jgi:hypothetical protein
MNSTATDIRLTFALYAESPPVGDKDDENLVATEIGRKTLLLQFQKRNSSGTIFDMVNHTRDDGTLVFFDESDTSAENADVSVPDNLKFTSFRLTHVKIGDQGEMPVNEHSAILMQNYSRKLLHKLSDGWRQRKGQVVSFRINITGLDPPTKWPRFRSCANRLVATFELSIELMHFCVTTADLGSEVNTHRRLTLIPVRSKTSYFGTCWHLIKTMTSKIQCMVNCTAVQMETNL